MITVDKAVTISLDVNGESEEDCLAQIRTKLGFSQPGDYQFSKLQLIKFMREWAKSFLPKHKYDGDNGAYYEYLPSLMEMKTYVEKNA